MTTPSIQQLLADSLLQHFPSAEVKKINKDNYVDILLPWVHPKRGTHLGFNTAGGTIKVVFYCREEEWVQQALANGGGLLEKYSQGIRLKGNPKFSDVKSAIAATLMFIELLAPKSPSVTPSKVSETYTFDQAVNAYLQGNMDYVVAYVESGNPVLQFNGSTLITNELISYVSTFTGVDRRIVNLVEAGVNLDASFDEGEGYTAAHFAAWDGKDEILYYLLDAGAKADVVGEDGYTPLFLAAAGGHLACIEDLVEKGADVNRRLKDDNVYFSKQGGTPLTMAFMNGFLETALFLIDNGADPFVLKEPCKNAPSPDLFVNFSSLVKQGVINRPLEGQLEKILSLVGKAEDENSTGENADQEAPKSSVSLDLNEFLKEIGEGDEEERTSEDLEEVNLDEVIKKFIEKQGSDKILEVLDEYYAQKGDIVVVEIDADDLINSLSTTDDFVDFVVISGIIKLTANTVWADLAKLIGETEVDWVKTLVQMENPDTIVLFYCGEKYVYAFSNMNANENVNGEDTSEEEAGKNKGSYDLGSVTYQWRDSEDDEPDEEEEEGGFPMISYRKPAKEMVEVVQQYLRRWQKSSHVYAWRMGVKAYIPEFVESLISDKVCPIFTFEEIEAICSHITSEKIIPVLDYVPEELYNHTKRVWWLVPFCIWKEGVASLVFVDKNGFYAMFSKDGEEEIMMIFNWDSVDEFYLENAYDGDPNINRLMLVQEDGNFLTFDEFVSDPEDGSHGSYLAVIEAIWEVRRETIEASKGESMWFEGKGGEGFKEFKKPQDLLKDSKWKNPSRPNPGMYGG